MSDLQAAQTKSIPRDLDWARRLGRRFSPAWGFIAYGVLYFMLVAVPAWLVGVFAFGLVLGDHTHQGHTMSPLTEAVVLAGGVAVSLLSWWPFARWVKRRRGQTYRLFAEGRLLDASVESVQHLNLRGVHVTRAKLRFTGEDGKPKVRMLSVPLQSHPIEPGATVPLLVHGASRYAAAFVGGRAFAAE